MIISYGIVAGSRGHLQSACYQCSWVSGCIPCDSAWVKNAVDMEIIVGTKGNDSIVQAYTGPGCSQNKKYCISYGIENVIYTVLERCMDSIFYFIYKGAASWKRPDRAGGCPAFSFVVF